MKRVIKKQAFTLVEIIAVLVIIGIMAAVAAPKFVSMAAEARNKAALAGVAEAKASLAVAYAKAYLSNSGQPTRAQVYTASGMAAGDVTFGDVVVTLADHANGDDVTVTTKSVSGTAVGTPVASTWELPSN
ncbi:MAG: prepilin-type N-terminal cleavage/methylation domain-containing protein [Lentisphaerae bacterium]|jgi:MSHA pilin protein MshA|nr:prepilin-type N-terminal cleavage/methylation domain-containing protein [Lentisphaerota bacterium]MBT4817491.1 prepilin-type N-terminal cleavage/methylation domain-containing protein [Lentisphaerota bacterium]MBT5612726.1 prepilin-type N-terminal cleavage/methylation domain-containing protein [Lentisphaerota bacterium]MBT7058955.1 prepilin-type N-terminal cleavage/methylation domain-containing protein [Lentisphaerota bacterium]MBT7848375.1 prepilin-type N-terminal cleavage/methylation domain